ncbi:hypothetical protein [Tateyamaria sp. SN3-11]|uniref:hypothetical protein n=1 Tax=Tateyamaria sp. SN3-11 TaxID=3092147 RepID=UPI0039EB63FF
MNEAASLANELHRTDWLEYISALGPMLIATFIAYIAYQQWVVNKTTLREKLFERRLKVFDETHDFLAHVMRNGNCEDDALVRFGGTEHRARFLFGPEIQERLQSGRKDAVQIQYLQKVWDKPENSATRAEMIEQNG